MYELVPFRLSAGRMARVCSGCRRRYKAEVSFFSGLDGALISRTAHVSHLLNAPAFFSPRQRLPNRPPSGGRKLGRNFVRREVIRTYGIIMKLPYSRLQVCGDVLFAARGGSIHSFNTDDGSYISTWTHSDVEKVSGIEQQVETTEGAVGRTGADEVIQGSPAGPPVKRQKLDVDDTKVDPGSNPSGDKTPQGNTQEQKQKGKRKEGQPRYGVSAVPDRPMISLVIAVPGGEHIVAASSYDKAIFVFAHDGMGHLKELSKR
jgi:hypothetical protein